MQLIKQSLKRQGDNAQEGGNSYLAVSLMLFCHRSQTKQIGVGFFVRLLGFFSFFFFWYENSS